MEQNALAKIKFRRRSLALGLTAINAEARTIVFYKLVRVIRSMRMAMMDNASLQKDGFEQLSDRDITAALLSNLRDTNDVPVENIEVKVEGGRAILSGQVDWEYQRIAVEAVADRTKGVVAVDNRIAIKPSVSITDVRRSIENALFRDAEIDAAAIRVTSRGGIVTMSGSVHSPHERSIAESAAWSVPGVKQVINRIQIGG